MHPSGRLVSRHKLRPSRSEDLPLFTAGAAPLCWSELVPEGDRDVEIEIGSGKGTFLVGAASSRPETFFVGIEASPAYASYAADRLARRGLENAVLVSDDARLFLADTAPESRVAKLHVYYPDPWPKRRHRKRRFFAPELPVLVHRCLRPGGELLIATDNSRYFGEILAVLGASPLLARSDALEERYGEESPGLAFGPTNFSIKYAAEGRPRHRAVYVAAKQTASTERERSTVQAKHTREWAELCDLSEIPEQGGAAKVIHETELALFRSGDRVFCLEDSCPHRGAALSEGTIMDGEIVCPWHGWRYQLEDGECTTLPGSQSARCFEVKVEDGRVWVRT
ncbi:MAG: nitrite reductase small subunit NirD [Planctomycetota bacterium]